MPAERPNILWITTDQQRYDTVAALGYEHMHTPHLDDLVRQGGVAFTRAYCQSPVCTPSRSSFMTGRYPSAVHQNRNAAASRSCAGVAAGSWMTRNSNHGPRQTDGHIVEGAST